MSETTALPPVTERGFTNLMITGYVYPMTMLPVTPLLGIYRSGKETYRFLEGTPLGSNEFIRIGVTVLATPFVALFMLWPFGIIEGTEILSDQVARLGLDKAVDNAIQGIADTVFGTIGSLLPKE
ncbi:MULTISPECIES: hypothetical protein [Chloracidobacterium]|jgi:hypothetical protein|uniref:Uncharacterized protein n=1 Tax=Chloracidobacterium thermophilum (strain B) TaxID=981222 RepID=G2LFV4_CHLTF|nr:MULTISPECIES: hypothetical protein [Chloracidobacterium]AEP11748.1 hypothetical protein Cabther_A0992 [Chloracidobacterium thermophilum B]QUV79620.1 hypothetical protein J8C08_05020 [Chloracidobacterium thermophilum]QUV82658.1 hypothetical protein J8C01_04830 [Chloracidobacterium sp. D]